MSASRAPADCSGVPHEKTPATNLQPAAAARPRIPPADAQARRAADAQPSSTERPLATCPGLIGATLPPRERLRRTQQFRAIHRQGVWVRARRLALGMLPNGLPVTRIGIRARRGAFTTAVARNHAKRRMRAIYQRHKARLRQGQDLVVVLQRADASAFDELESDFLTLCRRAGLLLP